MRSVSGSRGPRATGQVENPAASPRPCDDGRIARARCRRERRGHRTFSADDLVEERRLARVRAPTAIAKNAGAVTATRHHSGPAVRASLRSRSSGHGPHRLQHGRARPLSTRIDRVASGQLTTSPSSRGSRQPARPVDRARRTSVAGLAAVIAVELAEPLLVHQTRSPGASWKRPPQVPPRPAAGSADSNCIDLDQREAGAARGMPRRVLVVGPPHPLDELVTDGLSSESASRTTRSLRVLEE